MIALNIVAISVCGLAAIISSLALVGAEDTEGKVLGGLALLVFTLAIVVLSLDLAYGGWS